MRAKRRDVCHVCGNTFTAARGLGRHLKTVHNIGNDLACKCEICKKPFSRKENLKRHMEFFHLDDEEKLSFECDYCGTIFPRRDSLVRHIKTHMERNNFSHKIRLSKYRKKKRIEENRQYECDYCGKVFEKRKSIVSHLRNCHKLKKSFGCDICSRAYRSKYRLTEHMREAHASSEELMCQRCHRSFVKEESLKQHMEKCLKRTKVSDCTSSVNCVLCGIHYPVRYALTNHYTNEHGIEFKPETHEFDSREQFEEWKCKLEVSTITQYTSRRVCHTANHEYRVFECHRSGVYRERTQKDFRLRNLKKQGSKKLNGTCPGELKLRQDKSNGKCTVTFQPIHVGHEIGNESELAHIYLDKAKRNEIASQIAENVPPTEIIKKEQESLVNGTCNNRKRSLLRKDLHNIERKHVVNLFPISKDCDNVTTFVESNHKNILYYKEQQKTTPIIDVLKDPPESCLFSEHDFVMVYVDSTQKQKLKLFAEGGVICMGSTPDTNPYNFMLFTIMVLNLNNEGIPVGYALSTRNDEVSVTLFLRCIHTIIGDTQIKTFMSNMDSVYYNCWSKIFPVPETWLYCSKEVTQCWKQHLSLIQNEKTQQTTRTFLRSIQREMNEKQFKQTLEKFLNDQDPELQDFINYFLSNYAGTAERWAYCYRSHAGINKNDRLESFHEKLRKSKIKSLAEELHYLKTFLAQKLLASDENPPEKLNALKKHHEEALTNKKDFTITSLSEGYWQIDYGRQCNFIQKLTPRCASLKFKSIGEMCLLKCSQCETCWHQYSCSCQESAIHQNMCKHIHLLVTSLNEEAVSSSNDADVVIQDYYYVTADGSVVNILEDVIEEDTSFHQDIEDTLSCFKELLCQRIKTKEEWLQIKKDFLTPIEEKLEQIDQFTSKDENYNT
ncbi:uncharacterized protein LOC135839492 [Planococcus citri]|uniref:uncharacterized protein LOC135839492 n=1 Tax=Planococcus citri TaxID=170843 RepID=UPI0031F974CE